MSEQNQIFNFNGAQLRTVVRQGQPWFVLKDVCDVLALGNPSQVKTRLDDGVISNEVIRDALGRSQEMTILNEDGLYDVILESRKPEARSFRKWVTSDVLPAIRHHGAYLTPAKVEEVLSDPDTIIRLATQLKREREAKRLLEEENANKQRELEYKGNVIIGLVDEIDLATKRQILNRVVRKGGNKYQERWRELYKQFEMKYHLRLADHLERYNRTHKPKLQNKVDYIDKVLGKIPELYEIACKLFENDVKELVNEMYGMAVH